MAWYKLYGHYKNQTKIQVVSDCDTFRARAKELTRASDHVLEVGCSTGETSRVLAKHAKKVLAVDNSFVAVEEAKANSEGVSNVTFMRVDARG